LIRIKRQGEATRKADPGFVDSHGAKRLKGFEVYKASANGNTMGDPYEGTAGPADLA
jgi:Na+/H+-translocating membrane pyrophosphatase